MAMKETIIKKLQQATCDKTELNKKVVKRPLKTAEKRIQRNRRRYIMAMKLTSGNFETEVYQSEIPVLVDFYADWCGPCKAMAPVVETLADEYAGKAKVGKMNTDENQDIAMEYGIMSIPTFLVFKGGKVVNKMIGMQDKRNLVAAIEEAL